MKKILFAALFITITIDAQPQYMTRESDNKDCLKFWNDTLTVVLNNISEDVNDKLESIVIKYWNITPIDIISHDEFESMSDEVRINKTFMMFESLSFGTSQSSGGSGRFIVAKFLAIVTGNHEKDSKLVSMESNFIISAPLYNAGYLSDYYGLTSTIRNMQFMLTTYKENPDLKVGRKKVSELINKEANKIKSKTLLVSKSYFPKDVSGSIKSQEEFSNQYPYPHEFKTAEEIEQIVATEDSKYCYLVINPTPVRCYYVYDVEKGNALFMSTESVDIDVNTIHLTSFIITKLLKEIES